jgi:serine/threonine-protein kinase
VSDSGTAALVGGRYRIERELGGGGMSTVHLATDTRLDRTVALKIMRHDLDALVGGPERFAREIELTSRFAHPNLLPLLDSGTDADGRAFYVMPFIDGESLRDRLVRERRLDRDEALRIVRHVLDGLAYAHGLGVVHRDVKPENVLLTGSQAIVADFGIARALSPSVEHSVTTAGLAIGTPSYMSPEQSLGETVDQRTDLYALGCMLYEMIAGEVPFRAPSAVALLARKISQPSPDVTALRDVAGESVAALVTRAMARDPEARFPTAVAFLEALDVVRDGGMPTSVPTAPHNAIAVLAFTTKGDRGDDDDAYLGDGISEELMHALTRLGGLRITPRASAFAFRDAALDHREIGRRLNVRRIVHGTVRSAGDRIRISAGLLDATSGAEVWSARFDRRRDEIFDVEDEITAAVVGALKEELRTGHGQWLRTEVPTPKAPSTSVAAYEYYLKGRHFWGLRTGDGLRRSADLLEQAIVADPGFALAHAALADTLVTMGLYGAVAPAAVMEQAREAAGRALALDPGLAEALTARACVRAIHDWDWLGAEVDFRAALEANPQYPTAHQWYAMHCLVPQGHFDDARLALARAVALDPLSQSLAVSRAAVEYYDRQPEAALEAADEVVATDPEFAMGHYFRGLALELADRPDDALLAFDTAMQRAPSDEFIAAKAHLQARTGATDDARAALQLLASRAARRYISPVLLAQVHAGLGDDAAALAALEAGRRAGAADLIWIAVRPAFDRLAAHPQFLALRRAVALPAGDDDRPDADPTGDPA